MKFRFTTDIYPEDERLDGWREEFGRRILNAELNSLGDPREPFRVHLEALQMGQVLFTDDHGTPASVTRNKKQAADGDDGFTFLVNRRGSLRLSQSGEITGHKNCGVTLLDHGRPFEVFCAAQEMPPAGQSPRWVYAYHVPRRLLLDAAPAAEGRVLAARPELLEYLVRYSEKMAGPHVSADAAMLASMGDHIFDLLVLMAGGGKDAAELAERRGLRAVRLQAILDFIGQNLDNPALDRDMIAAAHGIGTRYVSRLMEEHGETLSHYILRLRLDRAAAMLADPAWKNSRVSDIAYACGFSDLSYFNRAFRRRFGLSPSAARA